MTGPPGARGERTPHEQIADDVEVWFNGIDRTLSNPETAAVYVRTLEVVGHVLRGAAAQDVISEEQRLQLAELLDAIEEAPHLV